MAYIDYTATATTASFAVVAQTAISASRASALTSGSIPEVPSNSTFIPALVESLDGKVAKGIAGTGGNAGNWFGLSYRSDTAQVKVFGNGGIIFQGTSAAGGILQQNAGTNGGLTWNGAVVMNGADTANSVHVVYRSGGEIVKPLLDVYSGSNSGLPSVRVTNSGSLTLANRANSRPMLNIDNGGGANRPQFAVSGSTAPSNTSTPVGWIEILSGSTTVKFPVYA